MSEGLMDVPSEFTWIQIHWLEREMRLRTTTVTRLYHETGQDSTTHSPTDRSGALIRPSWSFFCEVTREGKEHPNGRRVLKFLVYAVHPKILKQLSIVHCNSVQEFFGWCSSKKPGKIFSGGRSGLEHESDHSRSPMTTRWSMQQGISLSSSWAHKSETY